MIDLGDGVEVLALWYVRIASRGDWLGAVTRKRADDQRWKLIYRFRWYTDDRRRVFDSDDVKNWYHAFVDDDDPDEILAKVDLVAQQIAVPNRATVDRVLVRADGKKALELMSKRPWAHIRRVPIS
jgi:hypothetical protein